MQTDNFCTLVNGVVVVVVGAIVVVVGVVTTVVVGAVVGVTHSLLVDDDVTTPRSKMGAIAMTDKRWVDDRMIRTRAAPAKMLMIAKNASVTRLAVPPAVGNLQTLTANTGSP